MIGGGNSAAEEALHLTRFASQVTVLVRDREFKTTPAITEELFASGKVEVIFPTEVRQLRQLQTYHRPTATVRRLAVDGAFIFIGLVPNTLFSAT